LVVVTVSPLSDSDEYLAVCLAARCHGGDGGKGCGEFIISTFDLSLQQVHPSVLQSSPSHEALTLPHTNIDVAPSVVLHKLKHFMEKHLDLTFKQRGGVKVA